MTPSGSRGCTTVATTPFPGPKAVLGALSLYLDFINLFMMLLRLAGNRR